MKDMTKAEVEEASRQGWQLAPVYDTRGYFTAAILPTKGSRLESAAAAMAFVWARAKAGDTVCRNALSLVSAAELAAKNPKKRKK